MTHRVEWWLDLRAKFICESGVAGLQVPIAIAGQDVVVHFPELVLDSDTTLSTPRDVSSPESLPVTKPLAQDYWGIVATTEHSKPATFWVYRIVLTSDIDCPESQVYEKAAAIDAGVLDWWDTARTWVEVTMGQRLTPVGYAERRGPAVPFWNVPQGNSNAVLVSFKRESMGVYDNALAASADMVRRCFQPPATSTAVPFAWTLIRDARSLDIVGQFRRSLIDAGGAAEIAIKVLIDRHLAPGTVPSKATALVSGTLGKLLRNLISLGYTPQCDVQTDLVDVRNRATHLSSASAPPTGTESSTAIETAAQLVEAAYPLPNGLVRRW